jgi:hypothetical protein
LRVFDAILAPRTRWTWALLALSERNLMFGSVPQDPGRSGAADRSCPPEHLRRARVSPAA